MLIVTHTTGYRHDSIEQAAIAIAQLARDASMTVENTADPTRFDQPLDTVHTIVLVSTTTRRNQPETEWLTGSRRKTFQNFMRRGGGVVAIHGAADSHYAWDWYGRMIGARFARHPKGTPTGTVRRATVAHPSLACLPGQFFHTDEWYWFADVDPALRPLLTFSPASIGETGAEDHPVSWAHDFEGGRVFYTSLGHTPEAWHNSLILAHVRGGLLWASGRRP
ncbi:Crp/Fnr family transcriptional regulator [Novosphingobium barchaimii LL02]|uniref:Crp/Fnr family transcriptional regulator n=1 Tax=Novosphingobium barchaimii LL02 TaxID=1114963 RepID=A0A0J7XXF5_9SPHN|nr:Crp/Fnr family transcriptional regulator [Novosphingobium barchaimii LL02]